MGELLLSNFFDSHLHTPYCRHAVGEPEEYCHVAVEKGLKGVVFTCHAPAPERFGPRMTLDEYPLYLSDIGKCTKAFEGKLDVLSGLECDYMPGEESWLTKVLESQELDFVLGSVHCFYDFYIDRYYRNAKVFQEIYFLHLAEAAETGLFDALAHPDLVKNCLAGNWNVEDAMESIKPSLDRIAKTGVALELNTSGLLKTIPEIFPSARFLEEMHKRSIPLVLGSDSHEPKRVGSYFEEALSILSGIGYKKVCYYRGRKRQEVVLAC